MDEKGIFRTLEGLSLKDYKIILTDDQSDLQVRRIEFNGTFWYFLPKERVWVKSSGTVYPGAMTSNMEFEEGILQGENAAAFRALVKLNHMTDFFVSFLHKNTKLFKIKDINDGKKEDAETPRSTSKPDESDGPLSQISRIS